MAWTIGANDVANAMGTSVGSGALTLRRAVVVAAVLEFSGAFFAGGFVTDTVRKGILDIEVTAAHQDLLLYGMLGAMAAAATLLLAATRWGLPVSTTHSIVGAIVGFGAVGLGLSTPWCGARSFQIVASWVTSPRAGRRPRLSRSSSSSRASSSSTASDPMRRGQALGPLLRVRGGVPDRPRHALQGTQESEARLRPRLRRFCCRLGPGRLDRRVRSGGPSSCAFASRRSDRQRRGNGAFRVRSNASSSVLQIMTACAVAFAHGSNDVANSIGPLAAVMQVARGDASSGARLKLRPGC